MRRTTPNELRELLDWHLSCPIAVARARGGAEWSGYVAGGGGQCGVGAVSRCRWTATAAAIIAIACARHDAPPMRPAHECTNRRNLASAEKGLRGRRGARLGGRVSALLRCNGHIRSLMESEGATHSPIRRAEGRDKLKRARECPI